MHTTTMKRRLTVAAAILAFGAGTAGGVGVAQAKHGSDDPPRHDARDDHGGRHAHAARHHRHHHHHHRGRHHDDGPNHT
jgi:hypothetical protein